MSPSPLSQSYTAALAEDPIRRSSRMNTYQFSFIPRSPFVDKYVLGPLSLFTGLVIITAVTAGFVCLIPSIIVSKYLMKWPSVFNLPASSAPNDHGTNTSNTNIGSITAIKALSARSQMNIQQSGGPDYIAPLLMSQCSGLGPNIPGSRFVTQLFGLLCRCHFYLTGRSFLDQITEIFFCKLIKFGEMGLLQSRTCWLDDVVDSFSRKHQGKQSNVIILGAGYDTRFYRLDINKSDTKLYEVDAVGSQENKKRSLNEARVHSSHVRFVSCDFETQDWMDSLQSESDFDRTLPSLFIWEGVSYYLDQGTVLSTVSKISRCGEGSCIAFDYFDESCLNSTLRKSTKSIGETFKFGIGDVEKFVGHCNDQHAEQGSDGDRTEALPLRILEHLRCGELKERYIARCNGRYIGYLSEFGGCLLLGA